MKNRYMSKLIITVIVLVSIILPACFCYAADANTFIDECGNIEIAEIVEQSGNLKAIDTSNNAEFMEGDTTRYRRSENNMTDNAYLVYKMEKPISNFIITTYRDYVQSPTDDGEFKFYVSKDGKSFTPVDVKTEKNKQDDVWGRIVYTQTKVPEGNTYLKIEMIDIDGESGKGYTPQINKVEIGMGEAAKQEAKSAETKKEAAPKAAEAPKAAAAKETTPKNPKTGDYTSIAYLATMLAVGTSGTLLLKKRK